MPCSGEHKTTDPGTPSEVPLCSRCCKAGSSDWLTSLYCAFASPPDRVMLKMALQTSSIVLSEFDDEADDGPAADNEDAEGPAKLLFIDATGACGG